MLILSIYSFLQEMSDLIIQIEEKPIYVHKTILMIRSTYFSNMFQHKWTERNLRYLKKYLKKNILIY